MANVNLSGMKVKELVAYCRDNGIKGYSGLNREALITFIESGKKPAPKKAAPKKAAPKKAPAKKPAAKKPAPKKSAPAKSKKSAKKSRR